jgi:hypothetical protein
VVNVSWWFHLVGEWRCGFRSVRAPGTYSSPGSFLRERLAFEWYLQSAGNVQLGPFGHSFSLPFSSFVSYCINFVFF